MVLNFAGRAVLIVDDSEQYGKALKRMLAANFDAKESVWAGSTEEAYRLVTESPAKFSLLFVDYSFPGKENGCRFIERQSQEGLLAEKVVWLCTADPSFERNQEARAAGALGLIVKPFDRAQLQQQLEKAELALKAQGQDSF